MSTKIKFERIRKLITELSESEEFNGLAIAVVSVQGSDVMATIRGRMSVENMSIGLETLIDDINGQNKKEPWKN